MHRNQPIHLCSFRVRVVPPSLLRKLPHGAILWARVEREAWLEGYARGDMSRLWEVRDA